MHPRELCRTIGRDRFVRLFLWAIALLIWGALFQCILVSTDPQPHPDRMAERRTRFALNAAMHANSRHRHVHGVSCTSMDQLSEFLARDLVVDQGSRRSNIPGISGSKAIEGVPMLHENADAWGRAFEFVWQDRVLLLRSRGRDGIAGTQDDLDIEMDYISEDPTAP